MYHITVDGQPYCELPSEERARVEKDAQDVVFCGTEIEPAAGREAYLIRRTLKGRAVQIQNGRCPHDWRNRNGKA